MNVVIVCLVDSPENTAPVISSDYCTARINAELEKVWNGEGRDGGGATLKYKAAFTLEQQ